MPKQKGKHRYQPEMASSDDDDEISLFHKEKDKILLASDEDMSNDTEEEEVFPLIDEDSSDEDIAQMEQQLRQIQRNKTKKKMDSDLEDDSEDEALPDSRAWGTKQSWFMGGDVRDNKIILSGSEDEAGAAALEEKECLEIEKRQMAQMTEDDFLHPLMKRKQRKQERKEKHKKKQETTAEAKKNKKKKSETEENTSSETGKLMNGKDLFGRMQIQRDFSKLPKEAEFERIKEMHPEYVPMVADLEKKMKEMQERIIPLMQLVKDGKIDGLGATYVRMKYHIMNNYLICGGFYIYFIMKRTPRLHQHPVTFRLLELQQMYNHMTSVDEKVKTDIDDILEQVRNGQEIDRVMCEVPKSAAANKMKKRKAVQDKNASKKRKIDVWHEAEVDDSVDNSWQAADFSEEEEEEEDDAKEEERRAITYQMEKNKGLTAHKKKELKNPRVKHRTKYRRAMIRRKGQVRDFKVHKKVYTGEITGIRAGIIRSRKLN